MQVTAEIKTLKPWKGSQISFFMHIFPTAPHALSSSL